MEIQNIHIGNPVNRQVFIKLAADVTGLTPGTVNATMKVERSRKENGAYDKGYRYRVESKRKHIRVTGPKKD